jgi:plasmid stabilization system protein ParE
MIFKIRWSPKAIQSLVGNVNWWRDHHSEQQAIRFFDGFVEAIGTLRQFPKRCSIAFENNRVPFELREFHYGTGSKSTHRALFSIEADTVFIILVHRHSQADVLVDDIVDSIRQINLGIAEAERGETMPVEEAFQEFKRRYSLED